MPPTEYVPVRSGYGAGTKDFAGRANALRIVLAEAVAGDTSRETLVSLAADIDDMAGEYAAAAADALRDAGALDVVIVATTMKKGRPGMRIEVLARPDAADALEAMLLVETTTIGVRRAIVTRRALPRTTRSVMVAEQPVSVKVVALPNGGRRAKPEFDDVRRVAEQLGRPIREVFDEAAALAEVAEATVPKS
jgi:uncharacterized protein (DUF111 family)